MIWRGVDRFGEQDLEEPEDLCLVLVELRIADNLHGGADTMFPKKGDLGIQYR